MASRNRLSVNERAPREIWMMNGVLFVRVDLLFVGVLQTQGAAEQTDRLFEIVDVVGADRVVAIGMLEQFFRGNDHFLQISRRGRIRRTASPDGGCTTPHATCAAQRRGWDLQRDILSSARQGR